MKIVKLIIGIILLAAASTEYCSASAQLKNYFDIGIIIGFITMVFLSSFLIVNGISKESVDIRTKKFVTYFIIILLVTSLITFLRI